MAVRKSTLVGLSLGGVLVVGAAFAAWLSQPLGSGSVRPLVLLASHIVTPALAAALCLVPGRRSSARTDRAGWLLLALSAACWSVASMVFAWFVWRDGAPPYPSLADYLFIAFALPALAGLAVFSRSVTHAVSRWHSMVDGLTIAAGLVLLSWFTLLGDLFRLPGDHGPAWAVTVAYPVGDVTIAAVVLTLALRQRRARMSLALVGGGLLLVAVCDTFYVRAGMTGSLVVGQGFWQAGYTVGFLLVGVAALTFESTVERAEPVGETRQWGALWSDVASQGVVYVVLALGLVASVVAPPNWVEDRVLVGLAVTTLVLAVLRELLVLADTATLRADLEGKVRARTDDLKASQVRLRAVTETASDAIVVIDEDGRIRSWNAGAEALFGCASPAAIGADITDFIPERYRAGHRAGLARRRAEESSELVLTVELAGLRADGTEVPVELSLTGWSHDGERFFTGILRDISARKRAEDAAARERRHVTLLQQVALAANQSGDLDGAVEATLKLVAETMGWPVGHAFLIDDEDREAPLRTLAWHAEDLERYRPLVDASDRLAFTTETGIIGMAFASGEAVWGRTSDERLQLPRGALAESLGIHSFFAFPIRSGDRLVGALEFFAVEDSGLAADELQLLDVIGTQLGRVVEREQAQRRLTRLALHDSLTGLANRVLFHERLDLYLGLAAREERTVAVILLDLDGFKEINDSFGHAAGDRLLAEIGRRLDSATRRSDTVARLGGDEFAVALSQVSSPTMLEQQVARLREVLTAPMELEGRRIRPDASIGVTVSDSATTAEVLLRNADLAMYDAKAAGKGRASFFRPDMHREVSHRLDLETAFANSVDAGQLVVHYRPVVALSTGAVVAREAVPRWHHPDLGPMDPDELLRTQEGSDLAVRLATWVFETACADAAAWQTAGEDGVRLTLTAASSRVDPDLVARLEVVLGRTGLPASAVELQVPSQQMNPRSQGDQSEGLRALAALGVGISVEAFGAGGSSLRYLRELRVDNLQIGSQVVSSLPDDDTSCALVDAVVSMGLALGVGVTARGVHTSEQLGFLRARGCTSAQGPLLGIPAPTVVSGRAGA